jgi:hypothetical protein
MDPKTFKLINLIIIGCLIFIIVFCITQIICGIIYAIFRTRHRRIKFEDSNSYKDIDFVNIKDAVIYVLNKQNINTRQELDAWCNGHCREKFYERVRKLCRISWLMVDDPKTIVRRAYESLLPGYANSSAHS